MNKISLFKERIEKDFCDVVVSVLQDRVWWRATKKWLVFALFFGLLIWAFSSFMIYKEKKMCEKLMSDNSEFDFQWWVKCENWGYDINHDGILPQFYNNLNLKNLKVVE